MKPFRWFFSMQQGTWLPTDTTIILLIPLHKQRWNQLPLILLWSCCTSRLFKIISPGHVECLDDSLAFAFYSNGGTRYSFFARDDSIVLSNTEIRLRSCSPGNKNAFFMTAQTQLCSSEFELVPFSNCLLWKFSMTTEWLIFYCIQYSNVGRNFQVSVPKENATLAHASNWFLSRIFSKCVRTRTLKSKRYISNKDPELWHTLRWKEKKVFYAEVSNF